MNKLRIFQYALLAVLLAPVCGATLLGAGKAIAQAVTGSSQISSNGQKITINSPPNDVVSGPTNLTGTGSVSVNSQGSGSVGIDVRGSGSGMTFVFEGSVDGTNYVSAPCVVPSTGAIVTGGSANGTWTCQAAGYQLMRVRLSAISGGTFTGTLNASAGSNQPPIGTQGTKTDVAAIAGTAVSSTNGLPTNLYPVASGGLSIYFVQPTASDNHVNIKNGAGQVYKISVTNNSSTINYLRLYNAASGFNGCNSATNLVYQMAVPASSGFVDQWDMGMPFSTGISICVTSGYATTDTTNATASAMSVNVGYK